MNKRQLVRFKRRFEQASVSGYVMEAGPEFFMIARVSDQIWFDGFECSRVADTVSFGPDPRATFVETALQMRDSSPPPKPRITLGCLEDLLRSASREFPLLTIHREEVDHGACWIGRLLEVNHGNLALLEISPDASWEDKPTNFPLNEVTRVEFGGNYEEALHLVGGHPDHGLKALPLIRHIRAVRQSIDKTASPRMRREPTSRTGWWLAGLLERHSFTDRPPYWNNYRLVRADDWKSAFRKASEMGERNVITGNAAFSDHQEFLGVTDLVPLYESFEDGAELLWEELNFSEEGQNEPPLQVYSEADFEELFEQS